MKEHTVGLSIGGSLLFALLSPVGLGRAAIAADIQARSVLLPDTNAGKLVQGWLKACQTKDSGQIRAWTLAHLSAEAAKNVPVDDIAHEDARRCSTDGGYRVAEIAKSDSGSISLLMVGLKSGIWYGMQFNADSKGKIENVGYWPATPPESSMPKDLDDAAIAARAKAWVAQDAQAELFSGIVSVARGTQLVVRMIWFVSPMRCAAASS